MKIKTSLRRSSLNKSIRLWGVNQNNLKNLNLDIPLGKFTVICGPSGSGKSSLAFETLYAEGQRRYIESLSNYTKQFLNKAPKPDIEDIENIPPAISLEQKNSVKNSRSTVGTTTELVDFLRLLYEKVGKAYCPEHHITLEKDSPSSAAQKVLKNFADQRGYILTPIYKEHRLLDEKKLQKQLIQDGFLRILIPKKKKAAAKKKATKKSTTKRVLKKTKKSTTPNQDLLEYSQIEVGDIYDINDPKFEKSGLPKSDFFLVIDRLAFKESDSGRVLDSITQAYDVSLKYNGHLLASLCHVLTTEGKNLILSEDFSCSICNHKFPNITSQFFSFNSPLGACEDCKGFGNLLTIDENKVVPNDQLTIAEGALQPFAMPSAKKDKRTLINFCKNNKIDVHTAWADMPNKYKKMIWEGNEEFYGVLGLFDYLETKKYKMHVRVFLARYKSPSTCPTCKGTKLKPAVQQVLINNESITDLCTSPIEDLIKFFDKLKLSKEEEEVCKEPLRQVKARLHYLDSVGVSYLSLDRATKTLSGGEFQRISLSNQLGIGLSQTLYILDEPTIGLHPRDNDRLIDVLKQIKDLGNTLVVVEHDHDVIQNSEHVIEMGPQSGHLGGDIVFHGTRDEFYKSNKSLTAPYVKPDKMWTPMREPRPVDIKKHKYLLQMSGCSGNNLKNIDLTIPLNRLVTITGVSGSGKSTLITNTLYPAVAKALNIEHKKGLPFDSLSGVNQLKNILLIDQSPIGKTARSNPVTYLKVYDAIRNIFSSVNESRNRGYTPGTFSLNVEGGRCPVCKGLGHEVIDMMFMDDIEIPCDACSGKKFRPEVLEITYKGKNIHDILSMTVAEAMEFFVAYPNIRRPLSVLKEVGLEYITLGQSARTLSGGESQRLKVAKEINSVDQKSTLYILDEPTTGLHFREIDLLLKVLHRLVDAGSSVVLIEHNLDIIKNSDYIIDIGPEAGKKGGKIIAEGSPEKLCKSKKSLTGKYLNDYINVST